MNKTSVRAYTRRKEGFIDVEILGKNMRISISISSADFEVLRLEISPIYSFSFATALEKMGFVVIPKMALDNLMSGVWIGAGHEDVKILFSIISKINTNEQTQNDIGKVLSFIPAKGKADESSEKSEI